MQIRRARIENFRSIDVLDCEFDEVTTLIGPNGAGKSNLLRALDSFFNGVKDSLSDEDVFQGAGGNGRIRVRVDFDQLTSGDREALGQRYCRDESVTTFSTWRTWERGEDKITAKALAFEPFEEIRRATTASEKRSIYNEFRTTHPEQSLPTCSSAAAVEGGNGQLGTTTSRTARRRRGL